MSISQQNWEKDIIKRLQHENLKDNSNRQKIRPDWMELSINYKEK